MCIQSESLESVQQIDQRLSQQNVLLYGAPDVGKSYCISEENQLSAALVSSLHEIPSSSTQIIVDDLYTVYQEYLQTSNQELKERFESITNRDSGVCYITRPRCLDWAIKNQQLSGHITLSNLEIFELSYSRDDLEEIDQLEESLFTDVVESENLIEKIKYEYEFESNIENYRTYIPWIISRVSAENQEQLYPNKAHSFFEGQSESIRNVLSGYVGAEGLENLQIPNRESLQNVLSDLPAHTGTIIENIRDRSEEFLTEHSERLAGGLESIIGGAANTALPVVGPLLVSAAISPDNELRRRKTAHDALGTVLSGDVLPATRSVIEEQLELPPMTLESLHTFMDPSVYSKIDTILEFNFEGMEEDIDTLHSEFETIRGSVDELETQVEFVHQFISPRIRNSTDSLTDLEMDILEAERIYLNSTIEELDADEIPLHGIDAEEIADDLVNPDTVTVLKGPHGTGKTSSGYRILSNIRKEDVPVRIPNHGAESKSIITSALAGTDRPPVIFVPYRIGDPDSRVHVEDLTWLLRLVEKDIVRSLLIECRSEYYAELINKMEVEIAGMDPGSKVPDIWNSYDPPIELTPLTEEEAREVILWVVGQKESQDMSAGDEDHILSVTDLNPELTKIATRLACEGIAIQEVATQDQLVWRDIQNISINPDGLSLQHRDRVVKWLATLRGATKSDLEEFTELTTQDIDEILGTIPQYLNETNREDEIHFQLFPDIYHEIIFRGRALGSLGTYLQRIDELNLHDYCQGIAENIALVGETHQQGTDVWSDCLTDANRLLEFTLSTASSPVYYHITNILTRPTFPIDIELIDGNRLAEDRLNEIRETLERNARSGSYMLINSPHPANQLISPLSRLAGNHAIQENRSELESLCEELLVSYSVVTDNDLPSTVNWNEENQYTDSDTFVHATYGKGAARVATHDRGDEFWNEIETLSESAREAVTETERHEWSFFCHVVSSSAPVISDTNEITNLVENVETTLINTQSYSSVEDSKRGRALFYSNVVHQLMRKHSYHSVSKWTRAINIRTDTGLDALPYLHRGIVEICGLRCEELRLPYRWLEWIAEQENLFHNAIDRQSETVFGNYNSPFHLLRDFFALYIGFVQSPSNADRSDILIELLEDRIDEMSPNNQDIAEGALNAVQDVYEIAVELNDE